MPLWHENLIAIVNRALVEKRSSSINLIYRTLENKNLPMKARPLTHGEITRILNFLKETSKKPDRDSLLILMGVYTGFRIAEILSIRVMDVKSGKKYKDIICVTRSKMKGGKKSRECPLNPNLHEYLDKVIESERLRPEDYLFRSPIKLDSPISVRMASKIYERISAHLGLEAVTTHSGRKTFAKSVYENTGHDMVKTQKALGHSQISSTVCYLNNITNEEVNQVVLEIDYGETKAKDTKE